MIQMDRRDAPGYYAWLEKHREADSFEAVRVE